MSHDDADECLSCEAAELLWALLSQCGELTLEQCLRMMVQNVVTGVHLLEDRSFGQVEALLFVLGVGDDDVGLLHVSSDCCE